MRILAIDSSAFPASAAIVDEGRIIAEFFIHTKLTHSQTLMPMIQSVLSMSDTSLDSVNLIAVTKGPGSFTGVRIGVASAKGLAMPNNIPCCGISALEAIAYNFYGDSDNKYICACIDARCNQVYNAVFKLEDGKITRCTPDRTILIDDLMKDIREYNGRVLFAGDGALVCAKNNDICVAHESLRYQKASSVAFAASVYAELGETETAANLQPLYLQLPQATRELNARNKK